MDLRSSRGKSARQLLCAAALLVCIATSHGASVKVGELTLGVSPFCCGLVTWAVTNTTGNDDPVHDALTFPNGDYGIKIKGGGGEFYGPSVLAGQTQPGFASVNPNFSTFFIGLDRASFQLVDGSTFTVTPLNVFPMRGANHIDLAGFTPGVYDITVVGIIPEPETYALLLAGLGLLGFAARRRGQIFRGSA